MTDHEPASARMLVPATHYGVFSRTTGHALDVVTEFDEAYRRLRGEMIVYRRLSVTILPMVEIAPGHYRKLEGW